MCQTSNTREDTGLSHLLEPFQNSLCDFIGSSLTESARSAVPRFGFDNPLSNAIAASNYDGANSNIGSCKTVVRLDPDVVGWVIGKRGAHIRRVKQATGCCIWLSQSDLNLHIVGNDPEQEAAAVSHIETLIRTAPVRGVQINKESMTNFTTMMIDCPIHLVGLLIGRNGCSIKRIKQESSASIIINQVMGKVIICGSPEGTGKAAKAIENLFVDNGFMKDEYGSFTPCHHTVVRSPIIPSIDAAERVPKKINSAFSLNGGLLCKTTTPVIGVPPDSNDTIIDNTSLFRKTINSFEEIEVTCNSKSPTWCSTPTSFSDRSSERSHETPPPLYKEGPATSISCCTVTSNFRTIEDLLESMNLSHHLCLFRTNEMDMDALRLSSKEDLKALSLPIGAIIKLSAALKIKD